MTRFEKYRAYRNEISNMKLESLSSKEEVSKEVDKVHSDLGGSKLNYEQVSLVHELVTDEKVNFKRKKYIGLTKYEIFYFAFFLVVVIILVIFLVISGSKMWG